MQFLFPPFIFFFISLAVILLKNLNSCLRPSCFKLACWFGLFFLFSIWRKWKTRALTIPFQFFPSIFCFFAFSFISVVLFLSCFNFISAYVRTLFANMFSCVQNQQWILQQFLPILCRNYSLFSASVCCSHFTPFRSVPIFFFFHFAQSVVVIS